MLLTIVIPAYNRAHGLGMVFAALAEQTVQDFCVLVVDNSSTDDTLEVVAQHQLRWGERLEIEVKPPNGPASARNLGLARAASEFVLFLDSDVELAPDWIENALGRLSADSRIAAVGGKILYAFDPTRVNAYGGDLGLFGLAWDVAEGQSSALLDEPGQRIWINCSAMLARTEVCRAVGGFDERFFYGYEDSDIGWRLNVAGHEVWVYPDQHAFHHVEPDAGSTNPVIVFHYCKNRLRSILKDASLVALVPMLLGYGLYSLFDIVLRGPRKPKWQALWWNITHLRETLQLRAAIQSQRVTGDAAILRLGSRRLLPTTPLGGKRRRTVQPPASYVAPENAGLRGDDRV